MEFVGSEQFWLAAAAEPAVTWVAVVGKLRDPVVNVVEVPVTFQPLPEFVWSFAVKFALTDAVLFNPFSAVDGNVTVDGGVSVSDPPAQPGLNATMTPTQLVELDAVSVSLTTAAVDAIL